MLSKERKRSNKHKACIKDILTHSSEFLIWSLARAICSDRPSGLEVAYTHQISGKGVEGINS
jgi:hypothetical protein